MSIWDKISYLYDVAVREENVVGDWWPAVITALIALAGVGLQVWIGYKNEKSNHSFSENQAALQNAFEENELKKRLEFEDKWEQKKIDADIISKARIKWIESVRKLSAELISDIYNFKQLETNKLEIRDSIKRNSELLKLYFSSSKLMNSNEITVKKLFERLENTNDNNDKNEYMHIYITRLCEGLVSDMYIEKKELISIYEQKIKRLYNQIYDLEEFIYEDIYSEDAEEEINQIVDRRIPKEKEEQASEIFKKISSSKFKKDALIIDLATEEVLVDKFATVISVYLKIEWEKAKEGK